MTTAKRLVNISHHAWLTQLFFLGMRTFQVYSLTTFYIYSVTMPYIISP